MVANFLCNFSRCRFKVAEFVSQYKGASENAARAMNKKDGQATLNLVPVDSTSKGAASNRTTKKKEVAKKRSIEDYMKGARKDAPKKAKK